MKYIDVSEHQGLVDWSAVKGNVDGVILRAGYGKNHIDRYFVRNAAECNRLHIPCGAYWFSYAKSTVEAQNEAGFLLKAVQPYRMELPLAYDFEYASVDNAAAQGVKITKDTASSFVHMFCLEIERCGYWCLNYTNQDFLTRYYDEGVASRYGIWLAAWKLSKTPDFTKPPRSCSIWQWGGSNVPGIAGEVDTNESYVDFQKLLREKHCNHLTDELDDGDGGTVVEYVAKPKPAADPAQEALTWAQSLHIVEGDSEEDKRLALALRRYNAVFSPEDAQSVSGILS